MANNAKWQEHFGEVLDSVKGFDVIACKRCGYKHITPIPTPEELEKVYREEYYSTEKPLYLERHQEDLPWWDLIHRERYDFFESELPPGRRRLLDIGSGPGTFLLHGQKRGWQTLGFEPSSQSAAHSRELGLEVVEDFFCGESAAAAGSFDVIHMNKVLEHIPDPKGMVELARKSLNPGGILCITVPNDYSPLQQGLRGSGYAPWWVAPPHHINYFDFGSLGALVNSCGFTVLQQETSFPLEMFLFMGDDYVGHDALGRECHQKRKNWEQNLEAAGLGALKRKLYQALAELDMGRDVVIYAKLG